MGAHSPPLSEIILGWRFLVLVLVLVRKFLGRRFFGLEGFWLWFWLWFRRFFGMRFFGLEVFGFGFGLGGFLVGGFWVGVQGFRLRLQGFLGFGGFRVNRGR